jgi:general secretion pathway protein D
MRIPKRLITILATAGLLVWCAATLGARTRKGDRLYAQGHQAEQLKDYDQALDLYEQALATDPADALYQMASRRVRFQSAQGHVDKAQKLRTEGKLEEALAEFGKAYAIDPASPVAAQELQRTLEMIDRDKKRGAGAVKPEERGLTPVAEARREMDERLAAVMSVPELKPLSTTPINVKMNNQPPKVLFETVGNLAGINVLFDPEYAPPNVKTLSVEFKNSTLEDALNYLAMLTRSFWKPVSANAVFVAVDSPQKRNDYEEQVAKVIYINNAGSAGAGGQSELTEIVNAVRTALGTVRSLLPIASQNALIIRGSADQVALAEMLIRNLDRPKAEVVVDVIVMEVNKSRSRTLAATPTSGTSNGINIPVGFTPRNPVSQPGSTTGSTTGSTSTAIALSQIGRISTNDFSTTLPGATLQALMNDNGTKILQSPQVRAIDGMKASLRIGDRVPTASGGFQPLFGQAGAGASSLYSTFNYLDVGVNVDITPKVHGAGEVTLHVELDISNVKDRIDIGGISQPELGQRKITHDIRLKEGEVNVLGGLVQTQETKAVSGVPGLASIPLIRRLFSSEKVDKSESELMIALVPHIIRTPDLDELNYKGIASGNQNTIRLTYAPQRPAAAESAAPATQPAPAAPQPEKTVPPGPPAPAAQVLFSPAAVETQPGGTVILNLQVENATGVFAAPLRIRFDPNVLRLNEVSRGGFLASDGRDIIFTRNILNDTGDASVNLSRMPGNAGISGSGTLVTLTFQVIGKGITTVSAPRLTVQDSRLQPILTASPQVTITVK